MDNDAKLSPLCLAKILYVRIVLKSSSSQKHHRKRKPASIRTWKIEPPTTTKKQATAAMLSYVHRRAESFRLAELSSAGV